MHESNNGKILFHRAWAIPCHETFRIKPINEFIRKYFTASKMSIDPFARDAQFATYTNDINDETRAENHLKAIDFLCLLETQNILADLALFDPPYSVRQVKEMYEGAGLELTQRDTQYTSAMNWREERNVLDRLIRPRGFVLSFGWHSNGMQRSRGYQLKEVLLVAHGGGHYDTICIAEQKISGNQTELLKPSEIQSNGK